MPHVGDQARVFDPEAVALRLAALPSRRDRLTHLEMFAGARRAGSRPGRSWAHPALVDAYLARGVVVAVEPPGRGGRVGVGRPPHRGRHRAPRRASRWPTCCPALSAIARSVDKPGARGDTVLYLSPTKALAHDQLDGDAALDIAGVRAVDLRRRLVREERDWARSHANYLLTNPDMVHRTLLPGHARWATFWGSLRYVVVDECHHYRGVFGAHVAQILRRLRRVAAHYGATPTFVLASATAAEPDVTAGRLVGRPVAAVDDGRLASRSDGGRAVGAAAHVAARASTAPRYAGRPPPRRPTCWPTSSPTASAPSRSSAAATARRPSRCRRRTRSHGVDPDLAKRVAPYRGGYLPEDRRELEQQLRSGELLAVAATNALELGIDIDGLDAVVMAGFPGHPRVDVAADRPVGPRGPGRARHPGRPRRPARHLPRDPPRGAARRARSRRPSSIPATRTCSRRTCAQPPRRSR